MTTRTEKAVATVRYSEFKGKLSDFQKKGYEYLKFLLLDGHTTTTSTTTKIEDEPKKSQTSFISKALFIWFDQFVLTGKNREVNSKNLWTLDPEYR